MQLFFQQLKIKLRGTLLSRADGRIALQSDPATGGVQIAAT
jgi:hypothetical protein